VSLVLQESSGKNQGGEAQKRREKKKLGQETSGGPGEGSVATKTHEQGGKKETCQRAAGGEANPTHGEQVIPEKNRSRDRKTEEHRND